MSYNLFNCKNYTPFFYKIAAAVFALIFAAVSCSCENKSQESPPANNQIVPQSQTIPDNVRIPPEDAMTGPNGVRWLTLAPGSGVRPNDSSTVTAELSVWTMEGELLFSTDIIKGTSAFTMTSLQPFVRNQFKTLGEGGKARAWFPLGTAGHWANPAWRQSSLFIELKILSVKPTEISESTFYSGSQPYRFVLPDAGGAPADAIATPKGIRFVYMAHSKGEVDPNMERIKLEITAWQTKGIMLGEPLFREHKTVTNVSRIPNSVADILKKMRVGETIRLWLPEVVATALLPVPKNTETIVDVTLLAIE